MFAISLFLQRSIKRPQQRPLSGVAFSRTTSKGVGAVNATTMRNILFRRLPLTPDSAEQHKHALFEQWALPHKDYIFTACLYLTRVQEDAEDLAQETFLRAFRFFHLFTPGTNCRAWLLTIMHNTFRTRLKQHRHEVRQGEFDATLRDYEQRCVRDGNTLGESPDQALLKRTLAAEIRDALLALPEEHRSILVLIDIEELTYEEAAALLVCPIGTVRSRLSRARQALRKQLTAYAREQGYLKHPQLNATQGEDV